MALTRRTVTTGYSSPGRVALRALALAHLPPTAGPTRLLPAQAVAPLPTGLAGRASGLIQACARRGPVERTASSPGVHQNSRVTTMGTRTPRVMRLAQKSRWSTHRPASPVAAASLPSPCLPPPSMACLAAPALRPLPSSTRPRAPSSPQALRPVSDMHIQEHMNHQDPPTGLVDLSTAEPGMPAQSLAAGGA